MRKLSICLLLVAFGSIASAVFATNPKPAASGPSSSQTMAMHMPLVAPLFIEDGNFTSQLVLVNGSNKSTYADVVLRSLDGKMITEKRVSFTPLSQ
jgi:hypothetical protein